jgi:ABC-type molybdate transport system substrate-binding protein
LNDRALRSIQQIVSFVTILAVARGAGVSALSPATTLSVCHAGSVQAAFSDVERAFERDHPDVRVQDVSGGSVALAARLAAGLEQCDVYAAADYLDIDRLLKPVGAADQTIVFAKGRMVLAYLATDPKAREIAAPGEFDPPAIVPDAAADWFRSLLAPGVRISSSHPFLDPSGYRTHMMFQLAQAYYKVANLSAALTEHVTIAAAAGSPRPALGTDFNFQFTYEHSAAAAAKANAAYRYVLLPDRIDLSTASLNGYYAQASVTMPSIGASTAPPVTVPATRVAWGVTMPKGSNNRDNAIAFLGLLLGDTGTAALTRNGPSPISPALVTPRDFARLPASLRSRVRATAIAQ